MADAARSTWRAAALAAAAAALCACAGARPVGSGTGPALAATARKQLGRPYRFGGRDPAGFDCSGLAWWTHGRHGIAIPRSSFAQFDAGRRVAKGALAPGDLVFFQTYKRGASHVGVYAGRGTFIHAPKTGRGVAEERLDLPYWKQRFLGARRFY